MEFLKHHKKFELLYGKKSIWESEPTHEVRENGNEGVSV